ncbi:MAG: type IV toxin-antitoxin system AbiEi family antitoxin domain-containing protein [Deltaproteobacteria bacterium]|nr:type IV toxin-antitoxin system AbiEi family antitoxin domain-containing protein [Nannocystaceae bacterium]
MIAIGVNASGLTYPSIQIHLSDGVFTQARCATGGSMKFEVLAGPGFAVFTTRDLAIAAGITVASATRQLGAAAERGALVRLTRGIWANRLHPEFHPLAAVPKIIGPEEGHVSFLTALHLHGVISPIPRTMQLATTGHGRTLETPIGTYELFRLSPTMMREGIVWSETRAPYRIATAEKALIDTLYISSYRGRRFKSLPELDLEQLRTRRLAPLLEQIRSARARAAVARRLSALDVAPVTARAKR